METQLIRVDDIEVGERQRALSDDAVERLAASIMDVGLLQPITIRVVEEMEIDGEIVCGVPVLVAGYHRLAAARKLGWDRIACVEVDDDAIKVELIEIAENLHRHDLTKEQRDHHIRRYAELLQSQQSASIESKRDDRRGHRPQGIASKVAEATGLSKDTVRRALNPQPKPEKAPKPVLADEEVILQQVNAILAAWNRACPQARSMAFEQMDGAL
jgi:ParB-like chromosome segregation protein Spo0J